KRFWMLRFTTLFCVKSTGIGQPPSNVTRSQSGGRIFRLKSTWGGSSTKMFLNSEGCDMPNLVPGTIIDAMTALFWWFRLKFGPVMVKLGAVGVVQSVFTT